MSARAEDATRRTDDVATIHPTGNHLTRLEAA